MLIAEIKGKRCPDIEGLEDLFTSAVFGHLRSIPPNFFWRSLFARAWNLEKPAKSLDEMLLSLSVNLDEYSSLEIDFWRDFGSYGEPDLILHFTGPNCDPVVLLIEVKLYASKSGIGDKDQLAKYLRLIGDLDATSKWATSKKFRFVIYLTRNFASDEMEDSLSCFATNSGSPRPVLFGLEWRDLLEAANTEVQNPMLYRRDSTLLSEVAEFLSIRDLDGFKGFKLAPIFELSDGHFYKNQYFGQRVLKSEFFLEGGFYGN